MPWRATVTNILQRDRGVISNKHMVIYSRSLALYRTNICLLQTIRAEKQTLLICSGSLAWRPGVCACRSRALLKQHEWIAHLAVLTPSGFDLCPVRSRWCFPTAFTQMCLDADGGAWKQRESVTKTDRKRMRDMITQAKPARKL